MGYHFARHEHPSAGVLSSVARLWNGNAAGRHAFFPWTAERLSELLVPDGHPAGTFFTAHAEGEGGECVGFAHASQVREDGYPCAGVVEILLVDARHRRRGVGTELMRLALEKIASCVPAPPFADALGAWPCGYGFTTLADGSERSGVFLKEAEAYRLFRKFGFEPVRKSIVMRRSLHGAAARGAPRGAGFHIGKRSERTWLDRVFRGRELWDHELVRPDRRVLSRAIFGFMESESHHEGQAIFSLFGVNTAFDLQGRGYAGVNISNLMEYVRGLGGDVMELHVYADNTPAVRLYDGLGFSPVGETMMMHRAM